MVTRTDVLLRTVDPGASIIEIGPSYNGVAPKADGWNTRIVDVGTKSELIEKYRAAPVDINRIEEVDFVWRDGPLGDAVPPHLHASFDVLIASHVIEHTPDLVEFLNGAASLLTAAGLVILAIPDKRFCADYFRPITTTGEVLAAHRHKRTRHDGRTLFDYFSRNILARYQHPWDVEPAWHQCWGRDSIDEIMLVHSVERAYALFTDVKEDAASPYTDAHAWVFTPASFELLILELARLQLIDWRLGGIGDAIGCEFFVWLRRGGTEEAAALTQRELNDRRLALVRHAMSETREQISLNKAFLSSPINPRSRKGNKALDAGYAAYTVKQSILEERVEVPDVTGDDRCDRLIAELVDAKVALQMLTAELNRMRNTRDALAAGLDQAKTAQDQTIAELNHTRSTRDTLAVESEKWFQATIAVTADHSPTRPISRTPFWRQLFKPFNGRNGNQTITLANRARDAGNWALAVRYYRDALDSWPHDPDLWSQCAQALMNAGRTTEADIVFRRSRELRGRDQRE